MFLNKHDVDFFLKIFNKNYFCSLIIKKKNLYEDFVLKLYNNINFLTLFYKPNTQMEKEQYNFDNVIDFLIENEELFDGNKDQDNILNEIDDITRKMSKINFDDYIF